MKKLIFTAFAVMVFSSISKANTVEIEKLELQPIENENKVVDGPDCEGSRFIAYAAARSAGFGHNYASSSSYSVYFMCMGLEFERITFLEEEPERLFPIDEEFVG
ncbi:hypothetical protein [Flavobacterium notoginsengisoli]|uniref:hypothetical protein n=1 Tax=Flavobacterium notoginsengisoli TaxID=1478199 RepID=UPI00363914DB